MYKHIGIIKLKKKKNNKKKESNDVNKVKITIIGCST